MASAEGCLHLCTDPQRLCPPGVTGTPDELGWSGCSEWVALNWLDMQGPWVIEGVAVPRALRKWHAMHPEWKPPADRLIVLTERFEQLTPRQDIMASGLHEVLADLNEWLAPILVYR